MPTDSVNVRPTGCLFHMYPRQSQPQDCYVALDLESGELRADYDPEIGSAFPEAVYHNRILWYALPLLRPATADALLAEIAPLAQRVLDGSEIVWDGHNHVGRLNDDAAAASAEIERRCNGLETDVSWWEASEWFGPADSHADLLARLRAGEDVDAIVASIDEDGSEDAPYLVGLSKYVEALCRDLARA